jgi:mRNA interferase MazF
MIKDFDSWGQFKKKLDLSDRVFYVHPREVWWCSLGLNIGTEIDGKNENFERPVLVMNVYNKNTLFVITILLQNLK